jgi:hypothetical protein
MELKPYNIFVSVSYPPDTDTPGRASCDCMFLFTAECAPYPMRYMSSNEMDLNQCVRCGILSSQSFFLCFLCEVVQVVHVV